MISSSSTGSASPVTFTRGTGSVAGFRALGVRLKTWEETRHDQNVITTEIGDRGVQDLPPEKLSCEERDWKHDVPLGRLQTRVVSCASRRA